MERTICIPDFHRRTTAVWAQWLRWFTRWAEEMALEQDRYRRTRKMQTRRKYAAR